MSLPAVSSGITIEAQPIGGPDQAWQIELSGAFVLANGLILSTKLEDTLQHLKRQKVLGPIFLRAASLNEFDGAGVVLLRGFIDRCQEEFPKVQLDGASERLQRLLVLYAAGKDTANSSIEPSSNQVNFFTRLFAHVGTTAVQLFRQSLAIFDFLGATIAAAGRMLRQPQIVNWREIPSLIQRAGADGLTIVALTNLLIGAIMAFQGAVQLERFGASSMTPVMVTIAHLRELGPIMTAFIVAGRSGAGFAAELGTMRVNEEIDALKTMGLDPMPWLVIPRMCALLMILPLLVIIGNICGLLGGYIATAAMVDGMTWSSYWNTVAEALQFRHFATGVGKSYVFAMAIAMLACAQGLAARGGAAAVGIRTTTAVVYALFAVVILDCFFALFFAWIGV